MLKLALCLHVLSVTHVYLPIALFIAWNLLNSREVRISVSRNCSMLFSIGCARPSILTFLIAPRISEVKLIRFSMDSNHSFCFIVTRPAITVESRVATGCFG